MPYLNLDLDYFDHRKTKRLIGLLGRGAEVLPIRLWSYCGKFHCEDGRLSGYTEQEIEALATWWGKPGKMLSAMQAAGYMNKDRSGWFMSSWAEHQGHIFAFKLRGKTMAEARWAKARSDAASIAVCNAEHPPPAMLQPVPTEPADMSKIESVPPTRTPQGFDEGRNGRPKGQTPSFRAVSIANRIIGLVIPWHYDNCKVDPRKLATKPLASVIEPFVALTDERIAECWTEAVRIAHMAKVDGLAENPIAYCIACFKEQMEGK